MKKSLIEQASEDKDTMAFITLATDKLTKFGNKIENGFSKMKKKVVGIFKEDKDN